MPIQSNRVDECKIYPLTYCLAMKSYDYLICIGIIMAFEGNVKK